jgi:hypothetical protein
VTQPDQQLSIKQTRTGYWSVQRGSVQLSSSMTRKGAEAERELLSRLTHAKMRRGATRPRVGTRPGAQK